MFVVPLFIIDHVKYYKLLGIMEACYELRTLRSVVVLWRRQNGKLNSTFMNRVYSYFLDS